MLKGIVKPFIDNQSIHSGRRAHLLRFLIIGLNAIGSAVFPGPESPAASMIGHIRINAFGKGLFNPN